MKYILLPIGRFLLVVFSMLFLPFVLFFEGLLFLWDFKKQRMIDVWNAWFGNFVVQPDEVKEGEKYWYYKNPVDYLCRKKSYKIKGVV